MKADIHARNVIVDGVLEGNVNATGSLEITENGVLIGDVQANSLRIHDHASLQGSVNITLKKSEDNVINLEE